MTLLNIQTMKYSTILFSLLFLISSALAQNAWIKKEVGNGIFVNFPNDPKYSTTTEASTYVAKSENCLFMVLIQRNVIPNYPAFIQLEKSEQEKIINTLLDNVVKEKLAYTNNSTTSASNIKIGNYIGRELSYNAINPATGERGNRFCKLILITDKLYSFECWYLNDNSSNDSEKNLFLNSLIIQQN